MAEFPAEVDSDGCPERAIGSIKADYTSLALKVYGTVAKFTNGSLTNGNDSPNVNGRKNSSVSDPAVKENIVRIGDHPLGFGLYLFDYKAEFREASGYGRQFGVMADEVKPVLPTAVSVNEAGYRQVDYSMLGVQCVR